jgi:hypothetical protein
MASQSADFRGGVPQRRRCKEFGQVTFTLALSLPFVRGYDYRRDTSVASDRLRPFRLSLSYEFTESGFGFGDTPFRTPHIFLCDYYDHYSHKRIIWQNPNVRGLTKLRLTSTTTTNYIS